MSIKEELVQLHSYYVAYTTRSKFIGKQIYILKYQVNSNIYNMITFKNNINNMNNVKKDKGEI